VVGRAAAFLSEELASVQGDFIPLEADFDGAAGGLQQCVRVLLELLPEN
jgi:hypothetical protein